MLEKGSVLITDDCHEDLLTGLSALGYHCDYEPVIGQDAVLERIEGYVGLIINSKIRVDRAFLDRAVRLRFVGRLGSGMEVVDMAYAAERGVQIWSSPEGNRNAVAEHALGMLLMLANHLARADREVRGGLWRREANRGWELQGKTVGIVGLGNTGVQFARKLEGMGVRILAYDKYRLDRVGVPVQVEVVDHLSQIQSEADIISLHLPLTEETRHLVDRTFLSACRFGVVIMNTARGGCMDTAALIEAMDSGQVSGVCMDVFEQEKPERYTEKERLMYAQLFGYDQAVFSPHVAGWTFESKRNLAHILLDKIKRGE